MTPRGILAWNRPIQGPFLIGEHREDNFKCPRHPDLALNLPRFPDRDLYRYQSPFQGRPPSRSPVRPQIRLPQRVPNTDLMVNVLAEQKGFGLELATVPGCVRLWDPMLQANRPYVDGSKAWPSPAGKVPADCARVIPIEGRQS